MPHYLHTVTSACLLPLRFAPLLTPALTLTLPPTRDLPCVYLRCSSVTFTRCPACPAPTRYSATYDCDHNWLATTTFLHAPSHTDDYPVTTPHLFTHPAFVLGLLYTFCCLPRLPYRPSRWCPGLIYPLPSPDRSYRLFLLLFVVVAWRMGCCLLPIYLITFDSHPTCLVVMVVTRLTFIGGSFTDCYLYPHYLTFVDNLTPDDPIAATPIPVPVPLVTGY